MKSYEAYGKTVDEAIDAACAIAGVSIDKAEIEILELGGKGLFGLGRKDAKVRITVAEKDPALADTRKSGFGPKKEKKPQPEKKRTAATLEIKPIPVITPGMPLEPEILSVGGSGTAKGSRNEGRNERRRRNERRERRGESRQIPITDITEGEMAENIFAQAKAYMEPILLAMELEPQYDHYIKEGVLWIVVDGEKMGLLIGRRGETLNSLQYLVNLAINRQRTDHVRLVLDVEGYRAGREQTLIALARKMADRAVRTGRRVELEPMNPHERRIVHMALQEDNRVETSSRGQEPYRRVVISSRRRRRKNNGPRPEHSSETMPNIIIEHDDE